MNFNTITPLFLFFTLFLLSGCIILPSNTIMQATKARGKYEIRLMQIDPAITFGKGGYYTVVCGKMLNHNKCYGRYERKDSLIQILSTYRNCVCLSTNSFTLRDSTLYENDRYGVWYLY